MNNQSSSNPPPNQDRPQVDSNGQTEHRGKGKPSESLRVSSEQSKSQEVLAEPSDRQPEYQSFMNAESLSSEFPQESSEAMKSDPDKGRFIWGFFRLLSSIAAILGAGILAWGLSGLMISGSEVFSHYLKLAAVKHLSIGVLLFCGGCIFAKLAERKLPHKKSLQARTTLVAAIVSAVIAVLSFGKYNMIFSISYITATLGSIIVFLTLRPVTYKCFFYQLSC